MSEQGRRKGTVCHLQIAQAQNTHQRQLCPLVDLNLGEHENRKGGKDKVCDNVDGCGVSRRP